jgi:hypothetical protein
MIAQSARFLFMTVVVVAAMETGNWGSLGSTQSIAQAIGAAQAGRYVDGVAIVENGSAAGEARDVNFDFTGESLPSNDPSTAGLDPGEVTSDEHVGNVIVVPSEDGGWGADGLAVLNGTMINAVSPAGYAAVVLLRLGSPALVLATATPYPTQVPYPTEPEYPTQVPYTPEQPPPTLTPWQIVITETPLPTPTDTPEPTPTSVLVPSDTPTSVLVPTDTPTPLATPTETGTSTDTPTSTPTHTLTPTPTITPTPTQTNTPEPTVTGTVPPTFTPTNTPTFTSTPTPTNTSTNTPTLTPTDTEEPTLTPMPTYTLLSTLTPRPTPTLYPTSTPWPTWPPAPGPTIVIVPYGSTPIP